jgi:hypothetical protein
MTRGRPRKSRTPGKITCSRCLQEKSSENFSRDSSRTEYGGYDSRCKNCRRDTGRIARRNYGKKRRLRDVEKTRAWETVALAVRRGRMPLASTKQCSICSGGATEYHHHNGYSREHRLDVVPVCRKCHRKIEMK